MADKEKLGELLYTSGWNVFASPVGVNVNQVLEHLIANDVVPVVKCEKCVFSKYIEDSGNYKCTTAKGRFGIVKPYDFCSFGERRCEE